MRILWKNYYRCLVGAGILWCLTGMQTKASEDILRIYPDEKAQVIQIDEEEKLYGMKEESSVWIEISKERWEKDAFELQLYYGKTSEEMERIFEWETRVKWQQEKEWIKGNIPIKEEGCYHIKMLASEEEEIQCDLKICFDKACDEIESDAVYVSYEDGRAAQLQDGVYYGNEPLQVEVELQDALSGIKKGILYIKNQEDQWEEANSFLWKREADGYPKKGKERLLVHETTQVGIWVEDGNENGYQDIKEIASIFIDEKNPELSVYTEPSHSNLSYHEDVTLFVEGNDTDSGIKSLYIWAGERELFQKDYEKQPDKVEEKIVLSQEELQGNICIKVMTEDFVGNREVYEQTILMDQEQPVVTLEVLGEAGDTPQYVKGFCKLHVTVKEAYSCEEIFVYNGTRRIILPLEEKTADDQYEYILELSEGKYDIRAWARDQAGNLSETVQLQFIFDKTAPVIEIQYESQDEGHTGFYKKERKAIILLKDTGLDPEQIVCRIKKDGQLIQKKIQKIKELQGIWEGYLIFDEEGSYDWELQVKDHAGNAATPYKSEPFVLDFTPPGLRLEHITHQSSNREDAQFSIGATDEYLDTDSIKITVYKDGIPFFHPFERTADDKQMMTAFHEIPFDLTYDGQYEIEAEGRDFAGNETKEIWNFSINRYGSSFVLSKELTEMNRQYYMNYQPFISVKEVNVDPIVSLDVFMKREDRIILLSKDKDYIVQENNTTGKRYEYTYIFKKSVFEKDGTYELRFLSRDRAGNSMDTRSTYPIRFLMDREAPKLSITSQKEEGREKIHIKAQDTNGISRIAFYLNEELLQQYDREEIKETGNEFDIYIEEEHNRGQFYVIAEDPAKNTARADHQILWNVKKVNQEETKTNPVEEGKDLKETQSDHKTMFGIMLTCVMLLMACCLFFIYRKFINGKARNHCESKKT